MALGYPSLLTPYFDILSAWKFDNESYIIEKISEMSPLSCLITKKKKIIERKKKGKKNRKDWVFLYFEDNAGEGSQ